jgi:hypothetical protein
MTSQFQYIKMHSSNIQFVKKHSMDDCSRGADEFGLSSIAPMADIDNGGEKKMVQVVTTDYIDGKTAKANGATKFRVLEEFTYQDGKFGKKLQGKARLNDTKRTEGTLSLNKTNQKKCAEVAGPDSSGWVNKWFDFVVTSQVVEGKLQDVIYVTGLSQEQGL